MRKTHCQIRQEDSVWLPKSWRPGFYFQHNKEYLVLPAPPDQPWNLSNLLFRWVTEASLWVQAAEAQANHLNQLKRMSAEKSVDLHRNSKTWCLLYKAMGFLLLLV